MKIYLAKFHLYILLLFGLSFQVSASHIVGGEMTYNCLGNDQYEIKLTIFRDCENGNPGAYFDNPAYVGVFTGSGSYLFTESFFMGVDDTLDLSLSNPCYVIPPNVCIHTTTYRKVITLPYRVGGYHLSYQRCCRNNIIANINNPSGTGATYDVQITQEALALCNSSARFREWPPFYLCAGSPINYDNSAFDPDGDSIVYELCNPYDGAGQGNPAPNPPSNPPYTPVSWRNPYNLTNMMGGTDPFRIDPQTGMLSGTPPNLGTFVVGLCAKEYRNGVLIGVTKRDFQYTVGVCNKEVEAAFLSLPVTCRSSLDVFHLNTSSPATGNYQWDFGDGSTPILSQGGNMNHIYPDTGTYSVTLISGFGEPCSDTLVRDVVVNLDGTDVIVSGPQTVCEGDTVLFTAINGLANYNQITSYNWSPNANILSGQGTDSVWFVANTGNLQVDLVATNNNGCTDQEFTGFQVDFVEANFDTITQNCNTSFALPFENLSTASNNQFFWDFGGTGTSTDVFPTHTFPDTGTYQVTLVAGYNGLCQDTITRSVYVPLEGVELLQTSPTQACQGDTVTISVVNVWANYNQITNYNWTVNGTIVSGQGTNTITVVPDSILSFSIDVLNNNGCTDSAAGTVDIIVADAYFDSIQLGCNYDLAVNFANQSSSNAGTFLWDFGGAGTSTVTNPSFVFPDTGSYNVSLIAGAGTLCPDTFSRVIPMQINGAQIVASDSQIVCRGDTVVLSATNMMAGYNDIVTYQWTPDGNIITGQGTDVVTALANADINFMVIGTNDRGCSDTAWSEVNVTSISPAMAIYAIPDSIFVGQSSQLYATNFLEYIYQWQFDTTLSAFDIHNPVATPRDTRTYYLTVSNQFGCIHIDSVTVYIKPPECINPLVFVPNAFTPDGDGHNDVLYVEGVNINYMTIAIYNRWGQLIFESNDKSKGWDGTYKGKPLPPDVYGYYMRCSCDEGGELFLKGNITLIR